MKFEKGNDYGKEHRWRKGQSGNKSGVKRNALAKIGMAAEIDFSIKLTADEKRQMLIALLEMPESKLKELKDKDTTPAFVLIGISAILTDIQFGKMTTLQLLDKHLLGEAAVEHEVIVKIRKKRGNINIEDAEVIDEGKDDNRH